MIVFIGMETSGRLRRRFQFHGHETYSCDILPSEDKGEEGAASEAALPLGRHMQGDVFDTLEHLWSCDLWPDVAVFHPDCTYLTNSAEWAYKDPDFKRYPGVGYHQKLKPGTLFGAARRQAREQAINQFQRILSLPIRVKVIENPIGALSRVRKPSQVVQPYQFGDDASKATCLWFAGKNGEPLNIRLSVDHSRYVPPTLRPNGKWYWANQTDTGQNRLSPGEDRWRDRSRTYGGIADALVATLTSEYK